MAKNGSQKYQVNWIGGMAIAQNAKLSSLGGSRPGEEPNDNGRSELAHAMLKTVRDQSRPVFVTHVKTPNTTYLHSNHVQEKDCPRL